MPINFQQTIIPRTGSINYDPRRLQGRNGRPVGFSAVLSCFICWKYLYTNNRLYGRTKSYRYKFFQMPFCQFSCIGEDGGRLYRCIKELQQNNDPLLGCNAMHQNWQKDSLFIHVESNVDNQRVIITSYCIRCCCLLLIFIFSWVFNQFSIKIHSL